VLPLSDLSKQELEFLRKAIKRRQLSAPISEMDLSSVGRGALFARLGPLKSASEEAALALIELALANADGGGTSNGGGGEAVLAWTGPSVHLSSARPTTAVVLELLQRAQMKVLIAGYEFDHGSVLFESLHKAMQERGVEVSIFLEVGKAPSTKTNMPSFLALKSYHFIQDNWPFGGPLPQLFYYPDAAAAGSHKSMHAKCIVVDEAEVLLGSANFTRRGHERNIEVGALFKDEAFAKVLVGQFEKLVASGDFASLPAPEAPKPVLPEEAQAPEDESDLVNQVFQGPPAEIQAFLDENEVDERLWKLCWSLLEEGFQAPDVGEDLEDRKGRVIGTAELSWSQPRVAGLLDEQVPCRGALEADGWTCVDPDGPRQVFRDLLAGVGKEG